MDTDVQSPGEGGGNMLIKLFDELGRWTREARTGDTRKHHLKIILISGVVIEGLYTDHSSASKWLSVSKSVIDGNQVAAYFVKY